MFQLTMPINRTLLNKKRCLKKKIENDMLQDKAKLATKIRLI